MEWLPSAQSHCQNESFVNTSRKTHEKQKLNFAHYALFHMKTKINLKIFCDLL